MRPVRRRSFDVNLIYFWLDNILLNKGICLDPLLYRLSVFTLGYNTAAAIERSDALKDSIADAFCDPGIMGGHMVWGIGFVGAEFQKNDVHDIHLVILMI